MQVHGDMDAGEAEAEPDASSVTHTGGIMLKGPADAEASAMQVTAARVMGTAVAASATQLNAWVMGAAETSSVAQPQERDGALSDAAIDVSGDKLSPGVRSRHSWRNISFVS